MNIKYSLLGLFLLINCFAFSSEEFDVEAFLEKRKTSLTGLNWGCFPSTGSKSRSLKSGWGVYVNGELKHCVFTDKNHDTDSLMQAMSLLEKYKQASSRPQD